MTSIKESKGVKEPAMYQDIKPAEAVFDRNEADNVPSICRVAKDIDTHNTGVLVKYKDTICIVTACIDQDFIDSGRCYAWINSEFKSSSIKKSQKRYDLCAVSLDLLRSDKDLGYSIFTLAEHRVDPFPLTVSERRNIKDGMSIIVPQYAYLGHYICDHLPYENDKEDKARDNLVSYYLGLSCTSGGQVVSKGVVTAIDGKKFNHTAPSTKGSEGSPILDTNGEVIGINVGEGKGIKIEYILT